MNINFETVNQNPNTDKLQVAHGQAAPLQTGAQNPSAYALDFGTQHVDNNAYGSVHGAEEVKDIFGSKMDVSVQRKMMTIMSSCMSSEDYGKMMKEGFDPSEMEPEQVVTIVDHIKAELAKSGTVVAGYNDDLSEEQLKEVVGSLSQAKQIMDSLEKNDMPVNQENMQEIKDALQKAKELGNLSDGSKKYLVENQLSLSIDHLYKASFSAYGDGNKQGQGYYAQDFNGYYAKKAMDFDLSRMQNQISSVLEHMPELSGTEQEKQAAAMWLIEKGVPVTEETMEGLQQVEGLHFPLDEELVIDAAIKALSQGKSATSGVLDTTGQAKNLYAEAAKLYDKVNHISNEAVALCVKNEKTIHLKSLIQAQAEYENMQANQREVLAGEMAGQIDLAQQGGSTGVYLTATRQLLEVQLTMTIDANVRLLKSDFSIDTAPLTTLVEELKKQESKIEAALFGEATAGKAGAKTSLYYEANQVLKEIPSLPAKVLGQTLSAEDYLTLSKLHEAGKTLQSDYERVEESYEALMTKPRADMGDSIKKAFQNVDDILIDMNLELSEDNRKSLRILGYNNIPMTEENFDKVKQAYLQIENIVASMTPSKTLALIREGINPLTMNLQELENQLLSMESAEEENQKYAKFLYQLEQKNEITGSEREAYIGVYRLFRQIEKTDGAAIGSLVEQGAQITLGNLLTAVRSKKHGAMDYSVDDQFGGIKAKKTEGNSISAQIEQGVLEARMSHAIYRDLTVDGLMHARVSEETTLEELKQALSSDKEGLPENIEEQKNIITESRKTSTQTMEELQKWSLRPSAENLLAYENLFTAGKDVYSSLKELLKKYEKEDHAFDEMIEGVVAHFDETEKTQEAMEQLETKSYDMLEQMSLTMAESTIDLKQIHSCYKQLSIMSTMRQEESYHVPVEINGEMTTIHLVFQHDSNAQGTVKIATENIVFGRVAVKYSLSHEEITSYGMYENHEKKEVLSGFSIQMEQALTAQGFTVKEQNYVNSEKELDLLTFSAKDDDNNTNQKNANQLYRIAKTFLQEIRKIS